MNEGNARNVAQRAKAAVDGNPAQGLDDPLAAGLADDLRDRIGDPLTEPAEPVPETRRATAADLLGRFDATVEPEQDAEPPPEEVEDVRQTTQSDDGPEQGGGRPVSAPVRGRDGLRTCPRSPCLCRAAGLAPSVDCPYGWDL